MSVHRTSVREMRVAECMTRDVVTIQSEQKCLWALQMMSAANIGRLPVLDGERLVGIVTELDIRRRAPRVAELATQEAEDALLGKANIGGVMSCFPVTVGPEASIADATAAMIAHDVSTLPVIEEGHLVGILTMRDLVRCLARSSE